MRREMPLFFVKIRTISRKLMRARSALRINNLKSVELRLQKKFQFPHRCTYLPIGSAFPAKYFTGPAEPYGSRDSRHRMNLVETIGNLAPYP